MKSIVAMGMVLAGSLLAIPTAQAQPGRGGGHGPERIECTSRDYRLARCNVNWRDAELVRQTSSTRCVRGQTWGVDRRGVWVDRGCAGIFAEAGRGGRPGAGPGGPGGWHPGPGWDREIRLACSSNDFRYRMCQVDIGAGGRVRIERQLSDTACIEGRTWGSNRAGIWVDRGCAAFFVVNRRWN